MESVDKRTEKGRGRGGKEGGQEKGRRERENGMANEDICGP